MLPTILIIVGSIIVLFIIVAAMQSSEFRVVRSAKMQAAPATVFQQVNDFHNWKPWSPWAKIDPDMKEVYEGSPSGTGAKYAWIGNKKVGEGRMTITESTPGSLIRINLEFLRPFKATNTTEFTFTADGEQTLVTWSMFGRKNFMFKAVGLFMNMDKMVGGDFEKGLAQMRSIVEGSDKQ